MAPSIRLVTDADANAVSGLVQTSFRHFVGPTWQDAAQVRFLDESSPRAFEEMLNRATFAAAAFDTDVPIGFVMMLAPTKINSLFVHPTRLRQGIGKALWHRARAFVQHNHPETSAIELKSSSHAYQFYRALGFVPTADEQLQNGARFMPFSISLATSNPDAL
jgi:GNAT superfamily N-acetyltransferase